MPTIINNHPNNPLSRTPIQAVSLKASVTLLFSIGPVAHACRLDINTS